MLESIILNLFLKRLWMDGEDKAEGLPPAPLIRRPNG